ncbi:MAG: FixJ family two-component response regulator [Myxococcota bacterium]
MAVARLTHRERTVLQKVAAGTTHEVIAEQMGYSARNIRDELNPLERNRVHGGVSGLLRLVEEGRYSANIP